MFYERIFGGLHFDFGSITLGGCASPNSGDEGPLPPKFDQQRQLINAGRSTALPKIVSRFMLTF